MNAFRSVYPAAAASRPTRFQRSVLWFALSAMIAQSVSVSAQIVATVGAYQPQVETAANGVPLIQITTPSAAGVSRNQYQQFNVGTQGVVLNNSRTAVATELAGFVAGNPNLAAGTARLIVNEVTSNLPSRLRGYSEVGGARAELIIANPNGITCDGCGFINASRGVLTTGFPVFGAGGSLDAFRVAGGQITIDGAGLNASNIDRIDLIARAVKVNAGLWGQELNVVAGASEVAYADLATRAIAGSGDAPAVSIDVAQLGGMYAGKIRLISSEAGVGVFSAGALAAQGGDLSIDSAGRLTLAGSTQASGRIDLVAAQDIGHSGRLYGEQDVVLASGGALDNSGSLIARRSLEIAAARVDSVGTLAAGVDSQGSLLAGGTLRVAASGRVRAVGPNLAGGDLAMSGASLDLAGAQTSSGGALALSASSGDIDLTGGVLQSGGDLALNAAGAIGNDQGRVFAGQNLRVRSADFSNRDGQLVQDAGGSSRIAVGSVFDNRAGVVASNGRATLVVGELDNRGGALQAQGGADLSIAADGRVDNGAGGVLAAGGKLALAAGELVNGDAVNVGGKISAGVDAAVTSVRGFDNRQGSLAATRDIRLAAQTIDNRGGLVGAVSGSTTLATTGGALDNRGGRLEAAQALNLVATGLLNADGVLLGHDLRIDSRQQALVNTRGQLIASGTLNVDSGALANDGGLIQASGALAIDTHGQTLSNTDSAGRGILGESRVTLLTNRIDNQGGLIAALGADAFDVAARGVFDNRAGVVVGNGATTFTVGELDNRGGTVQAQGGADLSMVADGRIDNGAGGVLAAGGTLALTAGELVNGDAANVGGKISAGLDAVVTSAGAFDNRQGSLVATRDLRLAAQSIDNRGGGVGVGAVSGSTTLVSTGGALDNRGGRIEGAEALDVAASGVLNADGVLIGHDLRIDSRQQALVNTRGQLIASGTLSVDSGALANDGGLIQANGALAIDTHGQVLSNTDSAGLGILGASRMTLVAGELDNRRGVVVTLGAADLDLAVSGRADNSGGGLLVAGRSLRLAAGEVVNGDAGSGAGQISAAEDLNVSAAQTIDNRQGTIAAARNVVVSAQDISNGGGTLVVQNGSTTLSASGTLDNHGGRLWAGTDLSLSAGAVANAGGRLYAARDLALETASLSGDGIVLADRDLTLTLGGAYTQSAGNTIKANRNLSLMLGGAFVNQGTLSAVGQLSVSGASVANLNGASLRAASSEPVAAQSIANTGAIWANSVSLNVDTLDNSGGVYGQDVTIRARVLDNQGSGVIAAGDALNLYVTSSLGNVDGGLLYSSGRLAIAADASRDGGGWLTNPTGYVLNRSAGVEARGDLELTASVVDNRRSSAVTATRSVSSTTNLEQLCDGGWGECGNVKYINGTTVTRDTTTETCDSRTQQCSTEKSSQDYTIGRSSRENQGRDFAASSLGTVTTGPVETCFGSWCIRETTTETVRVADPFGQKYWGPAAGSIETFTLLSGVKQEVPYERRRVVISERLQDSIVSASPEARLLADGDLYLRAGTVNNTASRIEASGNLVAAVGTLNNTGTTLYDRIHDTIWHGGCSDIKNDLAGMLGSCASGWLWTATVSDRIIGSNGSLDAVFRGGQALALSAITVNNRSVDVAGWTPGGVNLSAAGSLYAGARTSTVVDYATPSAATPVAARPRTTVDAATLRALTPFVFASASGGLYTLRPAPGAPYLVETDPRFTQYSNFISSDYLLGRLGLDPAAVQKRLGDGYYEQQLVRDQIINQRGRASLGAYASLDAEYRALLEAGADYAREFSIVPGISLTQQQVASLAHDLVWLETRVVDGAQVLVPVVYLAHNAGAVPVLSGAVIGGGLGTRIDAVDVDNSGAIVSSGPTIVAASHDLVSDSGTIGGQSVVLAAGNDLHLGTATRRVSVAPGQVFTLEGFAGAVEGQSVSLSAGRDLTLAGGVIKAGNATLSAGRDLTIGTQTVSSAQSAAAGGSRYERSASAQLASRIDAGGTLTLVANNDLTVAGSRVESGGNLSATAGNNLIVSAAQALERVDYDSHHEAIDATLQSATSRAQASTLAAGGDLSLTAGETLASEGATLRAGSDVALAAGRIVLDAAYDGAQRSESYSNVGKYGQQQMQGQSSSTIARGTIVAAGGDLDVKSAGDTAVVGGALAAGRALTLETGGDLALLAAQSQSASRIDASGRDRRKATTLKYSDEETRQLLTTLAAGTSLALAVGGDFVAEVGEKNADGTLRADRMTAAGIVQGDARQQVSVTRSGVGANAHPTASQVRGDLASQGIRNGANDAFTPVATASGGAALERYLSSGLAQIRNEPVVAGELKRLLQSDGATLSTRDASGAVSLTVAGQAKVRDVYNTLKLSETFDEKHFANAGVAQAVTLVAAIALTVMTTGAGAASIGATMAGGVGTGSTVINAAVVAMTSTMTGQLAAGASFDEAFQAGIEAGATSAMTAGILNAPVIDGGSQGMQSINQLANVQTTGANIVGKFSADTLGQNLAGMAMRGVVNAGVNSAIYGGSFGESFTSSFVSDLAAVGANAVGLSTDTKSPGNVLGHAAVGAVAARLKGQDAVSGAIGGAASALVNPLLDQAIGGSDGSGWGSDPQTAQQWQSGTLQLASMGVSAGIASALGKDGMTAAMAAQNETVNNFLTRNGIGTISRACAGSNNPTGCQTQVAQQLNVSVDQKAANCRVQGTCKELAQQVADGAIAIKESLASGTLTKVVADALMAKQIQDLDTVLAAADMPKTDQTAVKALVVAGLAAPLIVACVADLPMCGTVLAYAARQLATNPATPGIAEGVLCAASGTACPLSVTSVSGTASTATKTAATAASDEIKVGAGAKNSASSVFYTGVNITPMSTANSYRYIGANGTFVTPMSSIESVIGAISQNATEITISKAQATALESTLGLNPGSLGSSNVLSIVGDVTSRAPRSPLSGNNLFLGGGLGLPGGGSELVIDSIPSAGRAGIRQITVKVK